MLIKCQPKLQLLCAAIISFFLVNVVNIHLTPNSNQVTLNIGEEAQARRSGGRSGGGSFRSSRSRSSGLEHSSHSSDSGYTNRTYSSSNNVYVVS